MPEIGEELCTVRETSNRHDRFAVPGTLTIGHVPAEFSKVCCFFSETWGYNQVQSVNWETPSFSVGAEGGLEVACELIFVADDQKLLKKLKRLYLHARTNSCYIICFKTYTILKQRPVSAALARTHRITQYHKLHGGRLHGELPKPLSRGVGACSGLYGIHVQVSQRYAKRIVGDSGQVLRVLVWALTRIRNLVLVLQCSTQEMSTVVVCGRELFDIRGRGWANKLCMLPLVNEPLT